MKPVHYFCPDCDHAHVGIPAIARIHPDIIAEKIHRALPWRLQVGDDVCRVLYPKPRRSFIRANLDIPVIGDDRTTAVRALGGAVRTGFHPVPAV